MPDFENKSRASEPYLPPPPESPEDSAPESLHMPRLDPPPASLEAMVRSRPGSSMPGEDRRSWVWIPVVIAVVAVAAYLIYLYR